RGVVVTALAESDGLAYAVFVTTSTESIDRTISLVTGATVPAIVVLTALVGLLVFAMARRSLRPVERLRREAASFDGGDLTRRLPAPGREDELGRLAGTMNAMLERIETATEQQRRFASDASHELRSPLASVAAQLDVDLAHPGTADWSVTAAGVRAETMRMQRLVDDLLLLARTGSGTSVSARDDLALDDLALDDVALDDVIVEATSVVSGAGGDVSVELGDVARATIRGDGLAIRRIVDNLLANAVRHASSTVRVSLVASDDVPGEFVIDVDDDGTGIAPEDRDRVFERFVRLDDARSRDQGGSGLGLAICRELAAAMGGRVTIGDSPLGGARFTLTVVDTADRAGLAQPPTATR
ncbi:MAG: ATP-binding protein, partial [Actinomycetota bacterium]